MLLNNNLCNSSVSNHLNKIIWNHNNEEYVRELSDRIDANRYNYKELLKIQQEISNEENA